MSRYIDADAIDWSIVEDDYGKRNVAVIACEALIENQTTIDAVNVVHGKWEHDGSVWTYRFNCTNCGYHLFGKQTNYCPNCGADMRKESE